MSISQNYCVKFAERPGVDGEPQPKHFSYTKCDFPSLEDGENFVIVKTLYLSVDPAQRCQMNEDTGVTYLLPWQIDEVITGLGSCVIVESRNPKFKKGDLVLASLGKCKWQLYWKTNVEDLNPCVADGKLDIVYYGLPGLTSILGVQLHGESKLLMFLCSLEGK
ncbi:prostaglandin reductase 2-like [Clytia hemisphaerica]|uniref:prostaglandin reductase 2-like n=1 Tax=Clytia hemisphaerica TaxID=252671 RepID=UPI0034D7A4FB